MPDYETLDRIADAHNPLLGLLWLALVLRALLSRRRRTAAVRALFGAYSLLVAYGLEQADIAAGLWPRLGLDYSTHTAVAVALVATLLATTRLIGLLALASFAAYVPLMIHQGYHGPGDVLTTTLAVALFVAAPAWRMRRTALQRGAVVRDRLADVA